MITPLKKRIVAYDIYSVSSQLAELPQMCTSKIASSQAYVLEVWMIMSQFGAIFAPLTSGEKREQESQGSDLPKCKATTIRSFMSTMPSSLMSASGLKSGSPVNDP